ncbi:uncharacterized protein [Centroberyx affinis]|uniref:uncharacterized protein isoform X2 n=1 Tax=Centroberyx affinis TaxID=166261 RepID=UPI003A5BB8F3
MEAVIGLLMVLLGVSHGVETYCDGRQNGTQCYGALGGTVDIWLTEAKDLTLRWMKNQKIRVLYVKNNTVLVNELKNRSSFTLSNRTFRISNLSYTDSAEYYLQTFNSDGHQKETQKLKMSIQAPVSTPRLADECLSQGEVMVSCSSEAGDSRQYSWTLDGRTLMDTELISGDNTTNNITLKPGLTGRLVCLVKNNVSNATASENISICKGFTWDNCTLLNGTRVQQVVREVDAQCPNLTTAATTTQETSSEATTTEHILPIAASLSVMVLLLVVVVGVCCVLTKKKKKEGTRKEQESEDAQDVTYADVRIMQRQAKPRQEKAQMEVEYGQVKVSGGRRQPTKPTEDDCVYAMVVKR